MRLFITGAGGLIGSAVAEAVLSRGDSVIAVDNDNRGRWFGPQGSTAWRLDQLADQGAETIRADFRDPDVLSRVKGADAVVHCASQPSHDWSRTNPIEDSAVNYTGTLALLEAVHRLQATTRFVFLSTNKVYGDEVNAQRFYIEKERFRLENRALDEFGIDESFPIDRSQHTPFGVSKLAADLMVQEYAHTFGLTTVSLRCGCLTGKTGSAVEMQGFLGYLVRCGVRGVPYTIYGHKGYQVRDNIDSADVASAILRWIGAPRSGVYNLGGGPENTISVLEAIHWLRQRNYRFPVSNGPERIGDHRWWVSDIRAFQRDYPGWRPTKSVFEVLDEMARCESDR